MQAQSQQGESPGTTAQTLQLVGKDSPGAPQVSGLCPRARCRTRALFLLGVSLHPHTETACPRSKHPPPPPQPADGGRGGAQGLSLPGSGPGFPSVPAELRVTQSILLRLFPPQGRRDKVSQ